MKTRLTILCKITPGTQSSWFVFTACKEPQLRLSLTKLTTGTVPRQGQMAECLDATAISQPGLMGTNQALGNCHQLESPAEKATPSTSHLHALSITAQSLGELCYRCHTARTYPHHFACPTSVCCTLSKSARK